MSENLLDSNYEEGGVSGSMKSSIQGTAPWMKFLGILFMVIGGLYTIAGFLALLASPLIGLLTLAMCGLYIYMGYLIFKAGSDYSSFVSTNSISSLESSLKNQKTWWMITGILTIVAIVAGIGMFIFGLTMAGSAAGDPEEFRRLMEQMNQN
mgnify:CR=1 FL=1